MTESRWRKCSRALKVLTGIWTLLAGLSTAVTLASFGFLSIPYIILPFVAFSSLFNSIIWGLLCTLVFPFLIPLILFIIEIILHRNQKYRANTIFTIIVILTILSSTFIMTTKQQKVNHYYNEITAPLPAAPKGLLIPGPHTVPQEYSIFSQKFMTIGYQINYHGNKNSYPTGTIGAVREINIAEDNSSIQINKHQVGLQGYPSGSYEDAVYSASYIYGQKLSDFNYQGEQGVVYGHLPSNGLISLELVWNDHGNPVKITVGWVPASQFSPAVLVNMLKSMVRAS